MTIYEIEVEVVTLCDMNIQKSRLSVCNLIDSALAKNSKLLEFHQSGNTKGYSFTWLLDGDKKIKHIKNIKYFKNRNVYRFKMRCISREIAEYLYETLETHGNNELKVITTKLRCINNPIVEHITTLTPMVLLNHNYWKEKMSFTSMTKELNRKLIRRYNELIYKDLPLDTKVIKSVILLNNKPIVFRGYGSSQYVCDMVKVVPENSELANEIMTMALATGLGTKTSRGFGYVNYKEMKMEVSSKNVS